MMDDVQPTTRVMSEHNPHNPSAHGFDAWQWGYDDAMYDGFYMASELPCQCVHCLSEYQRGQEDAFKEIFAGSKSAAAGAGTQAEFPLT
jgi:hypothetical protein